MSKSQGRIRAIGFATALIFMIAIATSLMGCASAGVKPPTSALFSQMQKPDITMPAPVALPARPQAAAIRAAGTDYVGFDASAAKQLLIRDEIGEQNTDLATECSAGFNEVAGAYGVLLDQAQAQERMFNQVGQRWADAENDLQRQDVIHETENWINRALIVLAVGIAL